MGYTGKGKTRAWQRMLSGRRLDLIDPSPVDVEIEDIAHGLARVARWNGQTKGEHAYSVAQHSLLVLDIAGRMFDDLTPDKQLMVLLHDAPEYVVGDMISPFKAVMGGEYKHVEARLLGAIHMRFSLPANTPVRLKTMIKKADRCAAYYEATLLAGFSEKEALQFFGLPADDKPARKLLKPLPASEAQNAFLQAFHAIEETRTQPSAGKG